MDTLEQSIAAVLHCHQGAENAIKSRDLCLAVNAPDRSVREAVSRLVIDAKMRIGSHPTVGFFLIREGNAQDRALAIDHLEAKVRSTCVRLAVLKKIPVSQVIEQLELFAGQEA